MSNKKTVTPLKPENILQPLIDYCQSKHGALAEVVKIFNSLGEPKPRTTIEKWLTKDPERRTEPLLSAGLRLLEALRIIRRNEIYAANGTLNKWLSRRRDYESLIGG